MNEHIDPEIVQHPSTPEEMHNPQGLVEACMAEFFPEVLQITAEYGFDVNTKEFLSDFRLVVEFMRATLYKQKGLYHDLQLVLGDNYNLNSDEIKDKDDI